MTKTTSIFSPSSDSSVLGFDLVVEIPPAVVELAKPVDVRIDRFFGEVVRPEQPLLLLDLDDLPKRAVAERIVALELDASDLDAGPLLDPIVQVPVGKPVPIERDLDGRVAHLAIDLRDGHPAALGQEGVQPVAQLETQPLAQDVVLELLVALELDGLDDLEDSCFWIADC